MVKREPWCGQAVWRGTGVPPVNHAQDARATFKLLHLTSILFVLAALFVGAAVVGFTVFVLTAMLTSGLVILRIASGRVMGALPAFIHITLLTLHLISVVWHNDFLPFVRCR
jgi:hypothetical protein